MTSSGKWILLQKLIRFPFPASKDFIRNDNARLIQKPAPPVANQNLALTSFSFGSLFCKLIYFSLLLVVSITRKLLFAIYDIYMWLKHCILCVCCLIFLTLTYSSTFKSSKSISNCEATLGFPKYHWILGS